MKRQRKAKQKGKTKYKQKIQKISVNFPEASATTSLPVFIFTALPGVTNQVCLFVCLF